MTDLAPLATLDLTTPQGVALARNRVLRKAWAEQDRIAVDAVLTSILEAQPSRIQEHLERVENAVNGGDEDKARAYLDEITRQFPDALGVMTPANRPRFLKVVLRIGDIEDAVVLADRLSREGQGDARLGYVLIQVYEQAQRLDRILDLADDVFAWTEGNGEAQAKLVALMVDAGHTGRVFSLVGENDDLLHSSPELAIQIARAHLRARPTDPLGLELLEYTYTSSPEREDVKLALAKAYLQFGRSKQALEVLEIPPGQSVTGKESYRQLVAETYMANDMFAEAGEIYRALSHENPLHSGWRRSGIGALFQAGEHAKANALYEEDRMRRRLSAHDTFQSRLQRLEDELETAPIPSVRFEWAYRKLTQLGAAPADRAAWERASRRVYLADILTIDWLETRSEDADQLLERIREPDKALAPLIDCLQSGSGAFIAALHMGSMFSGPALMDAKGVDFRWLASTPAVSAMPGADKLFSTTSMSPVAVARSVFRAIRGGSAVTIAIDGGAPSVSRPVSFLGDDILLTDMVPRTVFQTGARSFFPKVIWIGDEISLEFIELIPPDPSDSLESFTSIWFRDFMENVAEMCVEAPDNMRLAGGFWTNLAL